jgi:hypothetical protein
MLETCPWGTRRFVLIIGPNLLTISAANGPAFLSGWPGLRLPAAGGCLGRTTRLSLSYAITKKGCARSPSDPRSRLPSGKATSTSAKRCGKADGSSSQSSRNVAKRKPVLDILGGPPLPRSYVVVAASAKRPRSVRSSSCHGGTRHQA